MVTPITSAAVGWARTHLTSCGMSTWQCLQVDDQNITIVERPDYDRPVNVKGLPVPKSFAVNAGAQRSMRRADG